MMTIGATSCKVKRTGIAGDSRHRDLDRGISHDVPDLIVQRPGTLVFDHARSAYMNGLSAAQAAERLSRVGPNALPEAPPDPLWRRFVRQFNSPLIFILLFALAFDVGLRMHEGAQGWPIEASAIALILLFNAALGLYQEQRSEAALTSDEAFSGTLLGRGRTFLEVTRTGTDSAMGRLAVVRRLSAVEALGSVTVIATDKTGTLTERRMDVRSLDAPDLASALTAIVLANDADPATGAGDPLDLGLLRYAAAHGVDIARVRKEHPIVSDRPFDSAWKFTRVTVREQERTVSYVKGAPEVLLVRCALSDDDRESWDGKGARLCAGGAACARDRERARGIRGAVVAAGARLGLGSAAP
jgi:magnesium-transporting ATPase (P-type)